MLISGRRLLWHIRHNLRSLDWFSGIAVVLLMMSAAFAYFVLRPMLSHVRVVQQEAAMLRTQAKAKLASEQGSLNPAEQLASFYRFFPQHDTAYDWMAKLYNAAAQQNLILEQGEYRLTHDRDSKLTHYDIVLPVKGGYVQIRKFIAQAMADVPSLSLDGITFSRQKIGEPLVDAQIRFTLYLGDE